VPYERASAAFMAAAREREYAISSFPTIMLPLRARAYSALMF